MRFPNAAKGMKKIFTAEILTLISNIALAAAVIMIVVALAAGVAGGKSAADSSDSLLALAGGSLIGAGVLLLIWLVLIIISFIMYLVGIINSSRDEEGFKSALFFLILSIIASVVAGILYSNNLNTAGSILYSVSNLLSVFTTIFVISGGVKLADRLNRGDVSARGTNVLKLIIVINILSLILSLISGFMGSLIVSVTAGVLLIVSLLLDIVQYFMYLSFLSKAKKMLAK